MLCLDSGCELCFRSRYLHPIDLVIGRVSLFKSSTNRARHPNSLQRSGGDSSQPDCDVSIVQCSTREDIFPQQKDDDNGEGGAARRRPTASLSQPSTMGMVDERRSVEPRVGGDEGRRRGKTRVGGRKRGRLSGENCWEKRKRGVQSLGQLSRRPRDSSARQRERRRISALVEEG